MDSCTSVANYDLALNISFGLSALITMVVFILSVPIHPSRFLRLSSMLMLLLSVPMLRQLLEGNLEALIVGGTLLVLIAYQRQWPLLMGAGILLLTAKIQESRILLLLLALVLHRDWHRRLIAQTALWVAIVTVPFMAWKGMDRLHSLQGFPSQAISPNNALFPVLARLGLDPYVIGLIWFIALGLSLWTSGLRRFEFAAGSVGFLIASLLSSYAGNISIVTPLALGIIPLYQKAPQLGLALIVLYCAPYAFLNAVEFRPSWENIYWAGVLFFTWVVLALDYYLQAAKTRPVRPA